ncbi:Two-component system response regulator, receiver domain [Alteracholeplasma palmae J233]|uniref:Two-component system response regulator, receiver domain n=1 Tax=Alteracholeplasma palmae (strain ATCC 49389 / J233) TaxID=1318466 RepID=U4KKS8_ALTPJ|nr:LytTR family DNA-binding domain-containing protein [Alteracholeplasma palmae]CCV64399.1 Two-component system response regulator, receiver domain [Alteracholeplasma palmae J233]
MISVALCDDEKIFLDHYEEKISFLAKKHHTLFEVIRFESGEALLFFLEDHPEKFNIIYLDILMKKINGIDTAKRIKEINPNISIVFLTSTESFVFDSFEASPTNYLIKNKDDKKFEAIFINFIENFETSMTQTQFIYQSRTQNINLPFNKIIYFEIFKRIIIIHTTDLGNIEFYGSLNSLEEKLQGQFFVRTHRSFLVNLQYVSKITSQDVYLKTHKTLPSSRHYYNDAREILSNYLLGVVIND